MRPAPDAWLSCRGGCPHEDRERRRGRGGDPVTRPGVRPVRFGGAQRAARRPRGQGARARGRPDRPPAHRRARPAPGPGDGRPLPAPRPVHRPQCPARRQRGPGRVRAGLPVRRAPPVRCEPVPPGCRPLQRLAARPARVLLARHVGGGDEGRHPACPGRDRPGQRGDAPDAGRELHPRVRDRPGRRGERAALSAAGRPDRGGRAADRRVRRGPRPGRRDPPDGDRRHPDGCRRLPARQAAPGRPHRADDRLRARPCRGRARSPGWPRSAIAARSSPRS